MVKTKEDLVGKQFELLTVIQQAEDYIDTKGKHYAQWLCECSCSEHNRIVVLGTDLKKKHTRSCGCLKRKASINNGKKNKKFNKYNLDGEYGIGYTFKGEEFWFDLDDYDKIKNYCWFYDKRGYVTSSIYRDNDSYMVYLHRIVMEPIDDGLEVDHKNHPPRNNHKIDNRKSNLELVTRSENRMNASLHSNNKSGVTGVCWQKKNEKWKAYIGVNGVQIILGLFDDKDEAIRIRKQAEIKYYGDRRYDANN